MEDFTDILYLEPLLDGARFIQATVGVCLPNMLGDIWYHSVLLLPRKAKT